MEQHQRKSMNGRVGWSERPHKEACPQFAADVHQLSCKESKTCPPERSHWRVERRYTADGKAAQHHAPGEGIDLFITVGANPLSRRVPVSATRNQGSRFGRHHLLDEIDHSDRCQQELQQCGGCDFAIEYTGGVRFRTAVSASAAPSHRHAAHPSDFLTFEQIRMPEAIKRLINRPRGLLLVTGPTGSGKNDQLGFDY